MAETGSPNAEAPVENVVEEAASTAPAAAAEVPPAKKSGEMTADLQAEAAEANGTPDEPEEGPKSKSARKKAAKAAAAAAAAAAAEEDPVVPSTGADKGSAAAAADAADSEAPAPTSSEPEADAAAKASSTGSPAAPAPPTPATTGSVSRSSSGAGAAAAAAAAPPKRASSAGGSKTPAAAAADSSSSPASAAAEAAAPMERGSSAGGGGSGGLDDLADAPKVKALREQLSQNGRVSLTGGVAQPAAAEAKPESGPERRLSAHDKVNTTNALELLQSGTFKLVPGKDSVPYEKLMGLRLEDGIDVTRKEEYLSAEEFATVFKMERDAFNKLPQWKRLQLKKNTQLF